MVQPCASPDRTMSSWVESPANPGTSARQVVVVNDQAIPVFFDEAGTPVNVFNSISSVTSASEVVIASYTVPTGSTFTIRQLGASGTNNSKYTVYIDDIEQQVKRTWWGDFNTDFNLNGLKVLESQVIQIRIKHDKPMTSDHEAHIMGNLI